MIAPKIQNRHPILQLGLFHVRVQHLDLGLAQCLLSRGVESATVLHSRPQAGFEKVGTNLVVLRVCRGCLYGHWSLTQSLHVLHLGGVSLLERSRGNDTQAISQLAADAVTDDGLWQIAAIENPVCAVCE